MRRQLILKNYRNNCVGLGTAAESARNCIRTKIAVHLVDVLRRPCNRCSMDQQTKQWNARTRPVHSLIQ